MSPRTVGGCAGGRDAVNGERAARCLRRGARPPVTRSPGDGGGSPGHPPRAPRARGAFGEEHDPRTREPIGTHPARAGPAPVPQKAHHDREPRRAPCSRGRAPIGFAQSQRPRGPGFFPRRASGRAGARAPRARRISALAKTSPSTRRPSTVRVFGSGTGSPARGAPRRCQASPSTRRPELAAGPVRTTLRTTCAERSAHPRVTG